MRGRLYSWARVARFFAPTPTLWPAKEVRSEYFRRRVRV